MKLQYPVSPFKLTQAFGANYMTRVEVEKKLEDLDLSKANKWAEDVLKKIGMLIIIAVFAALLSLVIIK